MFEVTDKIKVTIISYFTGDLTQDQADDLIEWLEGNKDNLKYFREMGEVWQKSASLSFIQANTVMALKNVRRKITERGFRPLYPRELRIRFSTLLKAAAAILLLIATVATGLVFRKHAFVPISSAFVETSAPKGSKSVITLADGTIIWLNADTKLRYPVDFGTTNRNIYLDGEAYFKVAKNIKLPFRVNTNVLTVTALGTSFNVKAYSDEDIIETTLEKGKVRIDLIRTGKDDETGKPVFLKPEQNAIFHKYQRKLSVTDQVQPDVKEKESSNKRIEPIALIVSQVPDTRLFTSWKDSRWIFKNEKLRSLALKLERRYDVTIIFEDPELYDYSFSGILKEESLEQVLKAIRYTAPIRFEIDNKQVRLFEDKKLRDEYQKALNP